VFHLEALYADTAVTTAAARSATRILTAPCVDESSITFRLVGKPSRKADKQGAAVLSRLDASEVEMTFGDRQMHCRLQRPEREIDGVMTSHAGAQGDEKLEDAASGGVRERGERGWCW
jgi:hypothetical protein